jgi:hypothetical protein
MRTTLLTLPSWKGLDRTAERLVMTHSHHQPTIAAPRARIAITLVGQPASIKGALS